MSLSTPPLPTGSLRVADSAAQLNSMVCPFDTASWTPCQGAGLPLLYPRWPPEPRTWSSLPGRRAVYLRASGRDRRRLPYSRDQSGRVTLVLSIGIPQFCPEKPVFDDGKRQVSDDRR